jgi:lipopolysaccharide/colanic/teichoic acid biosynthesis glycosyltransferase
VKRAFDVAVSGLIMAAAAPLMFGVAALVRATIGSPVLFRQQRAGFRGVPFAIIKFRSMTDEVDANGALLPDAQRLTGVGSFLRSTSLDEFPELWNVIRGEMSLVGPRPLLLEYLPLYSPEQSRRHDVRPGITGLAQIAGRNALGWGEKFDLDLWYVDNRSMALDFKIMAITVWRVLRRDGISAEGEATMPKFRGAPEGPK